jgi:carboxyl-terminal processing protease
VSRDLVTIPSVEVSRLPHGIVYAAISHFSQTTPWDFRSHVEAAVSAGGVKGIIIDLRANSGGSMLGSAAIADLFLDEGVLITTAGRNGSRVSRPSRPRSARRPTRLSGTIRSLF